MTGKILVIHTSFLGDAILALPFLQELKKLNPAKAVHVLCSPRSEEIFRHSSAVNKVHVLEKFTRHKSIFATAKFALQLKKIGYQSVYSLHRSFRTTLITFLLGAEDSYGFDTAAASFVYKQRIKYQIQMHEVQRNLMFLQRDEYLAGWKIFPEISAPRNEFLVREWMQKQMIDPGFIALAPGSVWATKRYPEEYFVEIISSLKNIGYQPVLTGGGGETELCSRIAEASGAINICAKLPLIELNQLLKHSELLVTNDSALTHLGMAAGCRVLTIYCSTVPEFGFYPYSNNSGSIGITDLKCKPCGIHGHRKCPENHYKCGMNLKPQMVLDAIEAIIKKGKNEDNRN